MSAVVDLRKTDDPRDAIHQAVQLLAGGRLVAFPTETAYAACAHALAPIAVQRLLKLPTLDTSPHLTIWLKSVQEALDYVPGMDPLGQRLARRCWPGPVTLAFDVGPTDGLLQSLPAEVRSALIPDERVWIRVPAHEWVRQAGRLMPAPLIAGSESDGDGHALINSERVLTALDDVVDLIIDDGESRYSQPATVVHVAEGSWTILRPGVVTETMVGRLASQVFVFICTGNTCRSPLAEGLFRKMLTDALKCGEDELSDRGFMVLSAGIAAEPGLPASPEGVEIARNYGVDLRSHESQPVTDRLLEQADRILTMTAAHRDAILSSYPDLAGRVELLARDNSDISDPIGAGKAEYEACTVEIERHLRSVLKSLDFEPGAA